MGKVQSSLDPNLTTMSGHTKISSCSFGTEPFHKLAFSTGMDGEDRGDSGPSFLVLPKVKIEEIEQLENIGWGSTGVVKRCIWQEKEVAIKFMFPDTDAKKFKTELDHWCAIKHPNAVNVFAACTEQDNLCLVMEYMKEGSLKSYLHKKNAGKPTSWPMLYRIALDIAFVLQHLHSINRVYRDLNSENVLLQSLDFEGHLPVAKICDLGDCKILSKVMTPNVGQIAYMAPEVFQGDSYTRKADVYSYGILLWEMIARQEPFGDESFLSEISNKVIDGVRPKLPVYCPPSVAQLIKECWHQDPDSRPSFSEIISRLLILGKLWDHLQVDKLLADVAYETETTDTDFVEKNWDETTFTDLELSTIKSSPKLSKSLSIPSDAEDEQELRDPSSNILSRSEQNSEAIAQFRNFKNTGSRSKALNKPFKRAMDSPKRRIPKVKLPVVQKPKQPRNRSISVESKLRSLSKARSNLHQLLTVDEDTYSESESGLVIQVLRASLCREAERINSIKKENTILTERYKTETKHRKLLEQIYHKTRKELQRTSITYTQQPSLSSSFDAIHPEDKEEKSDVLKWCEIEYKNIKCESTPYYYGSVGIWFKGVWKTFPVRLCMVVGSIHRELLTKFRKLSTVIQQLTNHPNICNLLGIVSESPNFGILLSIPEGGVELRELVSTKKLSLKEKLYILRSIAVAVNHCHCHGRPVAWLENRSVFVWDDLQTQIVHICNLFYFSQRSDTQCEKFRWQAPEIFYGRNKSSKMADCFSLGLLIWYLITEEEPYGGEFTPDICENLSHGWRLPIPEDCPPKLSSLISSCWRQKPEERATAAKIISVLNELYQEIDD